MVHAGEADVGLGADDEVVVVGKAFGCGEELAAGSDHGFAVEDGAAGFVAEEIGVDVGSAEGAAAFHDEALTDLLFGEGEVAGAGVEDDVDAAGGETDAGAVGDPCVLTDFEAEADPAYFEEEIAAGERAAVWAGDFSGDASGPWFEPAWFVVDAVAGEEAFGGEAGDLAVDGEAGGIEETFLEEDGEAEADDHAVG